MAINIKKQAPAVQAEAVEPPAKVGSFLAQKLAQKAEDAGGQTQVQVPAEAPVQASAPVPASVSTAVSDTTEAGAAVMEYTDCYQRLQESGMNEVIERMEALKKVLQSIAMGSPPESEAVLKAPDGSMVIFSPQTNKTEITDKEKLIKLMTPEVFLQVAKVTLGDANKYLSKIQLEQVTTVVPGHRTLKSVVPAPKP